MGKYMKKSKITGDVAVMDVSQSTTLGVRTRAKTLALQRLHPPSTPAAAVDTSSFSYLQLRSRRLEKPLLLGETKTKEREKPKQNLKDRGAAEGCFGQEGEFLSLKCDEVEEWGAAEASFGENCLERERSTRESTPCSFIRVPDTIATPGSTTRQTSSTASNRRERNSIRRHIPTAHEMEEFFTCAEQQQQRLFIEKYNFDVVNDLPLSGRYDWVPVYP